MPLLLRRRLGQGSAAALSSGRPKRVVFPLHWTVPDERAAVFQAFGDCEHLVGKLNVSQKIVKK